MLCIILKRHFDRQKTYTMYNQEEYELEMQDSEFKNFMMQFNQQSKQCC